ncbi:hypothetical protein MKW98_021302, partial [Papaver atlanticum]
FHFVGHVDGHHDFELWFGYHIIAKLELVLGSIGTAKLKFTNPNRQSSYGNQRNSMVVRMASTVLHSSGQGAQAPEDA